MVVLTERRALLATCVLIMAYASTIRATEHRSIRRLSMGTVQQVWSEGKSIQEVEKDVSHLVYNYFIDYMMMLIFAGGPFSKAKQWLRLPSGSW